MIIQIRITQDGMRRDTLENMLEDGQFALMDCGSGRKPNRKGFRVVADLAQAALKAEKAVIHVIIS